MTALIGPAHAEQVAYLRRVFAAQPVVRDRVEEVLELPELYRNLVLLEVAQLAPRELARAVEAVAEIGCLACSHGRHEPGDCLIAMIADGASTYCLCGVDRG